jgi:peptidoglycan/xylan/chitin deacetylase (PgdA/CDA1 family)
MITYGARVQAHTDEMGETVGSRSNGTAGGTGVATPESRTPSPRIQVTLTPAAAAPVSAPPIAGRLRNALAVGWSLTQAHAARLSRRKVGLSLLYHRVDNPAGDPRRELDPALHTDLFERQIRYVKHAYRPVRAAELVDAIESRRWCQRIPLAVTFDDDRGSHLRVAAPVLSRHGVTATFFLSGTPGPPSGNWWDNLQALIESGAADEVLADPSVPRTVASSWSGEQGDVHRIAEAIKLLSPAQRRDLSARLAAVLADRGYPVNRDTLGIPAIRELATAGFEIGFHTINHEYLPSVDRSQLTAEVTAGRPELEAALGRPIVTFAYPHGGYDSEVTTAVSAAGYQAAFTTRWEMVSSGSDPMTLGRVEAPHSSATVMARRLSDALHAGPVTQSAELAAMVETSAAQTHRATNRPA